MKDRGSKAKSPPHTAPGRVRIIGGTWRGRMIEVGPGVRPSPDRVRETLFNWLAPVIEGARCLDLYAGTGVLGFEALSRGAREAVLVDRDPKTIARLREQSAALGADALHLVQADALVYLGGPSSPFDIVFLDPPYGQGLLEPACERLAAGGWLAPGAYIYLEAESALGAPVLPDAWTLERSKRAGEVGYHLAVHHG